MLSSTREDTSPSSLPPKGAMVKSAAHSTIAIVRWTLSTQPSRLLDGQGIYRQALGKKHPRSSANLRGVRQKKVQTRQIIYSTYALSQPRFDAMALGRQRELDP